MDKKIKRISRECSESLIKNLAKRTNGMGDSALMSTLGFTVLAIVDSTLRTIRDKASENSANRYIESLNEIIEKYK